MSNKTKTTDIKDEARPALVPKLQFPEFRGAEAWKEEAGDALFDQINDRNPEPGLPVLAITQEHGAIPRHMIDYHVSVTEKSIESYKVVRVGDFIISLRSFQGGIEYSRYHGICSPAYVILRRRGEGSDEYFRHYLKTDRFIRILTKNLEGLRDGKMISYAQFSELLLPVPTPPEQQKIAECLSSVDELMAAQARKVDALKTHKKGLMQQLFPRDGETQPYLRFSNEGDWTVVGLPEVAFFQEGPGIMAVDFRTEGVPLIRLAGVGGSVVTLDGCNYLDPEKVAQKWSHFRLAVNDLIISTSATFGLSSIVTDAAAGAVFYTGLIRFRPSSKRLDRGYLKTFLGSPHFARQAASAAVGGGIKHFGPSHIKRMEIPIPTLEEQQRIASCLSSLDVLITAETQKLEALKTHKKGLMQQLFPSRDEVEP
ncbi:restriction endonuclease subunit S [Thiobacillus sp.]|jgi:type I restriction enzyme S subunit|uniref:restriction endonuclease subunit S n=1 Tax=Thiobacillus sp. TaxID=924 RepID=UPI0025D4312B|nr:restriction endonuclease subunit S [Thiobacillus sp.]